MKSRRNILIILLITLLFSCDKPGSQQAEAEILPKGKLFIIGGGKRPVELIDRLLLEAGVRDTGYVLVLPFASEFEDTAIYYSSRQFRERGIGDVRHVKSSELTGNPQQVIERISGAKLIYISGGDQNRFMEIIGEGDVRDALTEAYRQGATIAGTSAGAAVMSSKMITGNEIKHPVYTGDFRSIEANNIELKPGLGFLQDVIIDQHFIKRQRMNRLISVALENPEDLCIGIDESTALLVTGNHVEVVGLSQVVTLQHPEAETQVVNGLLGGKGLRMCILLPGDSFEM